MKTKTKSGLDFSYAHNRNGYYILFRDRGDLRCKKLLSARRHYFFCAPKKIPAGGDRYFVARKFAREQRSYSCISIDCPALIFGLENCSQFSCAFCLNAVA